MNAAANGNGAPTAHLSNNSLRDLVKHGIDNKLFKHKDIYDQANTSASAFSKWYKKKNNSVKQAEAARDFLDVYFTEHALPQAFAPAAPDKVNEEQEEELVEEEAEEEEEEEKEEEAPIAPKKTPTVFAVATPAYADYDRVGVCSWNVKRWSSTTSDQRQSKIMGVVEQYDVAVLQEVQSDLKARRAAGLWSARMTDYDIEQSPELFRKGSRHKERIAVFYKHAMFEVVQSKVFSADMTRRPFAVTLKHKESGVRFTLVSVHIVYGTSQSEELRRAEIAVLIEAFAKEVAKRDEYGEMFLCGDFNMDPSDHCFYPLRNPLAYWMSNPNKNTTIGASANVYDTFWFPTNSMLYNPKLAAVYSFKGVYHQHDKKSRSSQRRDNSDHLPVSIGLDFGIN